MNYPERCHWLDAYVYKMWAHDGTLLYVGVTNDPTQRFYNHERTKPWFADVAKVDWYGPFDRHHALERERALQEELLPCYSLHPRHAAEWRKHLAGLRSAS